MSKRSRNVPILTNVVTGKATPTRLVVTVHCRDCDREIGQLRESITTGDYRAQLAYKIRPGDGPGDWTAAVVHSDRAPRIAICREHGERVIAMGPLFDAAARWRERSRTSRGLRPARHLVGGDDD